MLKKSLALVFLFSIYLFANLVKCEPELESEERVKHSRDESSESAAEQLAKTGSSVSDDDFIHGFLAALSVIIVSELGDKTFFIAAIM